MKRVIEILVVIAIWGCILILCGEKTPGFSQSAFYTTKIVALLTIFLLSRWLDKKCLNEENKNK